MEIKTKEYIKNIILSDLLFNNINNQIIKLRNRIILLNNSNTYIKQIGGSDELFDNKVSELNLLVNSMKEKVNEIKSMANDNNKKSLENIKELKENNSLILQLSDTIKSLNISKLIPIINNIVDNLSIEELKNPNLFNVINKKLNDKIK